MFLQGRHLYALVLDMCGDALSLTDVQYLASRVAAYFSGVSHSKSSRHVDWVARWGGMQGCARPPSRSKFGWLCQM